MNGMRRTLQRTLHRLALCAASAGLVLTAGCAGAGSLGASENEVTIALVSNSQMTDAQKLSSEFEKQNPGTTLKFISLGAVGEIGGRFFDADGAPVDAELQQRAVSVPFEDIRTCEKTMLISGGAAKHRATLGALRGKLARLLVCDIDCARWLLAQ